MTAILLSLLAPTAQADECTVRGLRARGATEAAGEAPARVSSLKDLYATVRALFLSEIERSAASAATKNLMRKRVLTLELETKQCSSPAETRAVYETSRHLIVVCEQELALSELALVVLLSHEIGHSVDLCTLPVPFYEKKPGGPPIRLDPRLDNDSKIVLEGVLDQKHRYFSASPFSRLPAARRQLEKLEKEGRVKRVDQGVPLSSHPLFATYRCLESRSGYPALRGAQCDLVNHSEPGAQMWAAKVTAAYVNAKFFSLRKVDLNSMFGNIQAPKSSGAAPGGKEKDYNEMFLTTKPVRSAFECTTPVTGGCFD